MWMDLLLFGTFNSSLSTYIPTLYIIHTLMSCNQCFRYFHPVFPFRFYFFRNKMKQTSIFFWMCTTFKFHTTVCSSAPFFCSIFSKIANWKLVCLGGGQNDIWCVSIQKVLNSFRLWQTQVVFSLFWILLKTFLVIIFRSVFGILNVCILVDPFQVLFITCY